jgi:hypothetical protein
MICEVFVLSPSDLLEPDEMAMTDTKTAPR